MCGTWCMWFIFIVNLTLILVSTTTTPGRPFPGLTSRRSSSAGGGSAQVPQSSVYKEVKAWLPGTALVVNKSRQELIKFQISHDFSRPFNCASWFNGQHPCSLGLNNGAFLQSYGCSSWICHANINSRMQITLHLGYNYVFKQCLTGAAQEGVMEPADCRRGQGFARQ